jgi:hypothetical protein
MGRRMPLIAYRLLILRFCGVVDDAILRGSPLSRLEKIGYPVVPAGPDSIVLSTLHNSPRRLGVQGNQGSKTST